ncbi:MAG: phosphatase PAP2 family protein [Saprospiraceae bacterium]|nr:phosphatase PAP2 family protein [Saprospiraceae bacterium]
MKNYPVLILAVALLLQSCGKDVEPGIEYETYAFATLDSAGGDWKTAHIDASQFLVPAPDEINSDRYSSEIAELQNLAANLTSEQREAVAYWGSNAVLRWNEIARELVAKYNLPPAPNEDGTYPGPNAANPGVYPFFPFANPPYTSRAYAYLSVAQYDALIVAWKAKYQYNRKAPYRNSDVVCLLPENDLPSYPSEDAVISAASEKVLAAMFPLEVEYLKAKAEEHRNSRLWAGANTQSDLDAGKALGEAVATSVLDRSKSDGMKTAGGNPAKWDSLETAAQTQFGWHWESQETPQRPGMLPFYGNVRTWCITNGASVRPGPPPAIGSAEFETAVAELKDIADNLTDDQRRIANFWGDGVGTYTPPGHWNRIAGESIIPMRCNPLRTARVLAYLNMAIADAGVCCWETKYFYHYPRPVEAIPGFKSLLGTPNFPSYTSGHSTFSGAGAAVLSYFFPAEASRFDKEALDASNSRIYGGIHYRFDCEVGLEVGKTVGEAANAIAAGDNAE